MPRYKYVCNKCSEAWYENLPMSFDPKKVFCCKDGTCNGNGERRIGGRFSFKVERETLGKWYKDKTGKRLMEE